jgi:hypothetical protein
MLFLSAALSLLSALVRRERRGLFMSSRARKKKVRVAPRRIAASLAFAALFFAGAALTAGAGNGVTELLDQGSESSLQAESTDTTTDTTATETTSSEAPAEPAPADEAAAPQEPAAEATPSSDPANAPVEADPVQQSEPQAAPQEPASAETALKQSAHKLAEGSGSTPSAGGASHGTPTSHFLRQPPVIAPQPKVLAAPVLEREPEADEPNVAATIWLNRALPDPTPPSRRLKPGFARQLKRISARNHVDWALTLAMLRASGERGSLPASKARLQSLTRELAAKRAKEGAWSTVLSLEGRTTFADRTVALMHLYRGVGLNALVKGFDWAKPSLGKQILNDKRITIYAGGRSDIERGRVNVRVLALIAYLAEAHGQVTVSCLISGHRLYARPGVVSAHIYGLAADISSLGGTSILGHQQQGSVTENAVRNILLLPAEMQARQVISLIGLGGPSFPLSNHDDHIHVGF